MRLSIGINDGRELKCQYHGWRYSNRTAGCTYIPAHPADAPARTITNRTYPADRALRPGLVGGATARRGSRRRRAAEGRGRSRCAPSRSMRRPTRVAAQLGQYRFQPSARIAGSGAVVTVEAAERFSIALSTPRA